MNTIIMYTLIMMIAGSFTDVCGVGKETEGLKNPALCSLEECTPPKKGKRQTCQCYCAAKGDAREWMPGDTGFIPSDDQVTSEKPKICYCRRWDFDNAPMASNEEAEKHIQELEEIKDR